MEASPAASRVQAAEVFQQPAEGPFAPAGPPLPRLLAERFVTTGAAASAGRPAIDQLLAAGSPAEVLRAWAAMRILPGERVDRDELAALLGDDIASLDEAIGGQVDAILHHPRFRQLEAAWRGLQWLTEAASSADTSGDGSGRVELRLLNASKRELARDRDHAVEFDRSALWRKIYEEEFGTAGGTPFGLLLADYEFGRHPDDVDLLTGLSEVAAAAFAPLLTRPAASLMGIDSLDRINTFNDLRQYQSSPEYAKWRGLRKREESRFVGLPLPGVLGRLPYDGWIGSADAPAAAERSFGDRGFRYREREDGTRLWIGAIWPLASVILHEFGRSGWFADIRGGSRGFAGGGQVEHLPIDSFAGLRPGEAGRGPAEVVVTDAAQVQLEQAGLIPLCASGADGRAVFHVNPSLHEPERFDKPEANANAKISAMLQYVLCVSRFAHYLKVIMRDKLGSFTEPVELERFLNDWLNQYVTPDDRASPEVRARLPLRAGAVEVREEPGTAGAYRVVMYLQPHFQLDQIDATLRLVTTVIRQESR